MIKHKKLLIIFFILLIIIGLSLIVINVYQVKIANKKYNELKENINLNEELYPNVNFKSLEEINPSTLGWIYFSNTNISYPIVKHKDNEYYLNHLFDHTENSIGSIYMDYRNNSYFLDKNTIIYGHNSRNNDLMFSSLLLYKSKEYYKENPYYIIITKDKKYKINIFSGYETNVKGDSWKLSFKSDEEFKNWINSIKSKSIFKSKIEVNSSDRIITLSTCSFAFDNARFILHGVLTELKD